MYACICYCFIVKHYLYYTWSFIQIVVTLFMTFQLSYFCVLLVILCINHLYRERAIYVFELVPNANCFLLLYKNMFKSNQSLCGALLSFKLVRSWARDFPSMDTELTSTFLHSTPVQHLLSSSVKCYGYWSIITILILWILLILNDIGKVLSWWVHGARRLQLLQKKH